MSGRGRTVRVLPDDVANQIAAGEVVERPASVVKELVENALDAGARGIRVELELGGKRRIRVADDGTGMGREDALLSLDRHATSKLRAAGELQDVRTLGFRGEALPSIAAISRFRMETRNQDSEVGTALRVSGGRLVGVDDCPRQKGTTVEVLDLFHNAPARKKFLRPPSAETRATGDVMTALALAHPEVSFQLLSDGRSLLDLPVVRALDQRVADLWGRDAADTLLPVAGEADGFRLEGWIQRPDAARSGFRRVHLYVGRRPFRDSRLVAAADDGYRTTLPAGARPWLLLSLQVPPGSVDVNVHPAKAEVRFQDPVRVGRLVEGWVQQALGRTESAAHLGYSPPRGSEPAPPGRVRERVPEGGGVEGTGGTGRRNRNEEKQMALFVRSTPPSHTPEDEARRASTGSATAEAGPLPPPEPGALRPRLWQAHGTYILAETRDGLLLIDQHAAHERVLFEGIMEAFDTGGAESQRLLFPITVRLTPAEFAEVQALKGVLRNTGFEVEGFGGDTVIIHAVPAPHPHFDAEGCFRAMVEELTQGSPLLRSARNQFERVAMSFACKAAVKAGQALDRREMEELFDRLFATRLPSHDVHGRPTIVRLGMAELERKFGRNG